MLSKIEITIDFDGPRSQTLSFKYSNESFSNFTELFLLSLSTICTIIDFIRSSEYNNLNSLWEAIFYWRKEDFILIS